MAAFPSRLVSAVTAPERPPRLVLRFAIFTALGLALAGAAILLIVRQVDTVQSQRHAISRARLAAEATLKHELRPADLVAPVSARRQRALDKLAEGRVLVEGIHDVTVYSTDGRVTYSTESSLVGRRLAAKYVREALAGVVVSEIGVSAVKSRRVLRTYVPVVIGPKRATGVVALEQDYAPIETAARHSAWLIAGVLEALLLLLLVIFVPVLARVSRRIRRHVHELDYLATHDELTEMPNRLGFRRAVEEMLAERRSPGALLLIDLVGFSQINDVLGSESGDAVLALVAARLHGELAGSDVARLGNDEFGVLLRTADRAEIAAVAERVRQSLAPPFLVDGLPVAVEASMGAALLDEHGSDFGDALRRAGAALSAAKEEWQSSLEIYEPRHDAEDVSRVALLGELREALDAGQLLVHFQPQADLTTRTVRGVEALLRWQHPQRGLLTAGAFIAEAERSGLAKELRHFVLETSAREWQEWRALGANLELAVNLSTADLLDASLPDEIAGLLERHGIPPWNLILEITEGMVTGDERRTRQVIDRLDRIGIRLAIDDFGTGYSSLASLRRFPVHQIKLDQSLLAGVPGDAAAEAIVSSSVDIAHALHATVVAEGIETRAQWKFVYTIGCDIAQGYLVCRPVPADELIAFLDATPNVAPLIAA